MRVRFLAALVAPLMLAGCDPRLFQGAGGRPDNTRVRDAVRDAAAAALAGDNQVSLAFPRVTNLHPGDIFEQPVRSDGYVTFPLTRRLCNLGEELGPGIVTEVAFLPSKRPVDRVFGANAHLKFDLAKIASFSLGDATSPIYAAHVVVSNAEALTPPTGLKDTMYPSNGPCAQRVARSVAAGREVVVITAIYNAAVYTRIAWTAQAGVNLAAVIGPFGGIDAGVKIEDTDVYGQETGDNSTMLAAGYRRIYTVEQARGR